MIAVPLPFQFIQSPPSRRLVRRFPSVPFRVRTSPCVHARTYGHLIAVDSIKSQSRMVR